MLIRSLENPSLYDHPVERFEVIETHISWVLLTGPYAYKIKKPVNLGFVDFSTLEKRRHDCLEELRLNRRLAPQLYLEVVAIAGSEESPAINGPGPILEYAVKMVQFPQEDQLDRVLERGELRRERLDEIVRKIAAFHGRIDRAHEASEFGSVERTYQRVKDNFLQIRKVIDKPADLRRLYDLERWTEEAHAALLEKLRARRRDGFVRECHGDMHLGNMALLGGEVMIFDCIEFNPHYRWNDVISEAAFLAMDLHARERPDLANRFLNSYLEITGDYAGLAFLRYYLVYRAMVRAKVACIRFGQGPMDEAEKHHLLEQYAKYLRLAERFLEPARPVLTITHGLSGSGKTTATQEILERQGAIRVRSDIERKRLFGLQPLERSGSALDAGLYGPEAFQKTYNRLAELSETILVAGYPVLADAAFLKWKEREQFRALARRLSVPFGILHLEAPEQVLRQRIAGRTGDASEASLEVLKQQIRTQEKLREDELKQVVRPPKG
ncbi:MAG: AAA family ATPase [Planctomycetes bacterium]|nr:AAA family ATPase [Planctomycetota bacterium]